MQDNPLIQTQSQKKKGKSSELYAIPDATAVILALYQESKW